MLTFLVDHRGDTGGDWVDDGCSLNASREGSVRCTCDHMTHFALLLQVKEDAQKLVGNSVECFIYSRTILSSILSSLYYFSKFKYNKKTKRTTGSKLVEHLGDHDGCG